MLMLYEVCEKPLRSKWQVIEKSRETLSRFVVMAHCGAQEWTMRFWITKNSELPVREQLVRQVVLGILSEDLPVGYKLPSIRALAQRHKIHSNTVSAAYHDLLQQGWLEMRPGSGVYVRTPQTSSDHAGGLDRLLTTFLQSARSQGYEPEEVARRLEHLLRSRSYEHVLIVEPEAAMREILQTELRERLGTLVEAVATPDMKDASKAAATIVVALPTRAAKVRRSLPEGVLCVPLRLSSVPKSLEGQTKPGPDVVISIVSRSAEIRHWARTMLLAVGLDPEALREIDAAGKEWKDRIGRGAFVVADVVAARELPGGCLAKVFLVVADSCLEELKQLCGG
jgi:GntR family transcriptional regulator